MVSSNGFVVQETAAHQTAGPHANRSVGFDAGGGAGICRLKPYVGGVPELVRLDRYENRAASRRDRAFREMSKIKPTNLQK